MNSKFELNEMELEQVAGGRPRITLHGPRRNDLQRITEVVHTIKKLIHSVSKKINDSKPAPPNRYMDPEKINPLPAKWI